MVLREERIEKYKQKSEEALQSLLHAVIDYDVSSPQFARAIIDTRLSINRIIEEAFDSGYELGYD